MKDLSSPISGHSANYALRRKISVVYVSSLTALAIVLKFKFFEIPYPPANFLKYDLSGVPLAIIAFMSFKYVPGSLLLYFLVHLAIGAGTIGADPIGMAMKCLAELSTFTPLVLTYKKVKDERMGSALAILFAVISRTVVMVAANYAITPYWLLWMKWAVDLQDAYMKTLLVLPHIALFNATLALVVSALALVVYRVLRRSGFLQ